MTNREKDIEQAKRYILISGSKDLDSSAFIYIKNGKTVFNESELEEFMAMYVRYLETEGIIKFAENRHGKI